MLFSVSCCVLQLLHISFVSTFVSLTQQASWLRSLSLFLSLQNITFMSCAAYTVYVSPVSSFSLMTLTHICTSFSYPCPRRRSLQTCFTPPIVLVWRHFSHLCIHHVNSSWLDPHIYMNDITRSLSLYTVGYT